MPAPKQTHRHRRPSTRALQRRVDDKRLRTEAHLGMSIAEWRLKKRQEWAAVMRALDRFEYGSAYTPVGGDAVRTCASRRIGLPAPSRRIGCAGEILRHHRSPGLLARLIRGARVTDPDLVEAVARRLKDDVCAVL